MSRIGKYPVPNPFSVDVTIAGGILIAKGKRGQLTCSVPLCRGEGRDGKIAIQPVGNRSRETWTMWAQPAPLPRISSRVSLRVFPKRSKSPGRVFAPVSRLETGHESRFLA